MLTHYELLGLRPEATDTEVREAIAAARASWSRRRDASAAPAAVERATAALARLDEAARDLGTPDSRREYDEASLPRAVLIRIRPLRGYPDPSSPLAGAETAAGGTASATAVAGESRAPEEAERDRLETEQAIRAEAERRREARRQEEERAAHERRSQLGEDGVPAPVAGEVSDGRGKSRAQADSQADPDAGDAARADRRPERRRPKHKPRPLRTDIDWRTVSVLALATAAGIGIALVPVAMVTSGKAGTMLLTDAASGSAPPRVLPVTGVSATISQPPTGAEPLSPAQAAAAATAAALLASDDEPASAAYAPAAATEGVATERPPRQTAEQPAATDAGSAPHASTSQPVTSPPGSAASGARSQPDTRQAPLAGLPQPAQASPQSAEAQPAPESPHSILRRAYAAYSSGRYNESLRLYDQVLGRKPDDPIARVARALTLLALSRPHDAEVECRIAIKIQPTFPEAHFNLGIALHRQRRDDEAVAAFRRFVELAPDDKAAPQARGFIARWTMAMQASASRRVGRGPNR